MATKDKLAPHEAALERLVVEGARFSSACFTYYILLIELIQPSASIALTYSDYKTDALLFMLTGLMYELCLHHK